MILVRVDTRKPVAGRDAFCHPGDPGKMEECIMLDAHEVFQKIRIAEY